MVEIEQEWIVKFLRELADEIEEGTLVCDELIEERKPGERDNIMSGMVEFKPTGVYKTKLLYRDPQKQKEFKVWQAEHMKPWLGSW